MDYEKIRLLAGAMKTIAFCCGIAPYEAVDALTGTAFSDEDAGDIMEEIEK